ncbi:hypothetical protein [Kosakonia oryzendophytica]|uniref:hypothetical protein n=1 Tax=Kosakonia oryzendophytica TaxID=1005665 RepID=UPI001112B4F1|nr:hypothetical protein [Kosakonia oryzendophytica]WBT56704.1 hypothetical protein O9K67_16175 [Kosakonia oryzendophytica]
MPLAKTLSIRCFSGQTRFAPRRLIKLIQRRGYTIKNRFSRLIMKDYSLDKIELSVEKIHGDFSAEVAEKRQ